MKQPPTIPVITYHSITNTVDSWQFRHLSCPVSTFEDHLNALCKAKFETIALNMLYAHMSEGKEIPHRSVVLTFDDGYLDNWVYAFPLLKKYQMHGSIFVTPDFVDPTEELRPNLEDVLRGYLSLEELITNGFLCWNEMRAMQSSGLVDIQSHGLTHTWYFSSPEIIDFHNPRDSYPWLAWNAYPERKYLWMTEDQRGFIPWGTPIYKHEKSLATRRYFPDKRLDTVLQDFVLKQGAEAFFQSKDWRTQLEQVVKEFQKIHGYHGYFETDMEYETRVYRELVESKKIIERELEKSVQFVCWPGGGYDEISVKIAKDAGYLASIHSSWDRSIKINRFGEDPSHVSRISAPAYHYQDEHRVEYKGGFHLICLINSLRKSLLHKLCFRALKIPYKIKLWATNKSSLLQNI
jgi:peptidoglycan/xylan/chitin deacetylase (PgdA/CDA1 family)